MLYFLKMLPEMVGFYIDMIRAHPLKSLALILFLLIIFPIQMEQKEIKTADLATFKMLQKKSSLEAQEKLNSIKSDLQEIDLYLANQKRELDIILLKKEKAEQTLAMDDTEVELLFSEYQKHLEPNSWWDKALGFFIGIITSLFASFIHEGAKKRKADNNNIP